MSNRHVLCPIESDFISAQISSIARMAPKQAQIFCTTKQSAWPSQIIGKDLREIRSLLEIVKWARFKMSQQSNELATKSDLRLSACSDDLPSFSKLSNTTTTITTTWSSSCCPEAMIIKQVAKRLRRLLARFLKRLLFFIQLVKPICKLL